MSTHLQLLIAVPMVLTAVLRTAGARTPSSHRLSRTQCNDSTVEPGRRPMTRKPGILRLAVTILPFYLLTGALATNTRAELIWGNMTYFANGNAALAKASKKYTGAYAFSVEPHSSGRHNNHRYN